MFNKYQLASAGIILAHSVWCEYRVAAQKRKKDEVVESNTKLTELAITQLKQLQYLLDLLERNEIQPTAFDLIALNDIIQD